MTVGLYDDISPVREAEFPLEKYGTFINFLQQQAHKYQDNICSRYQVKNAQDEINVKTLTYAQLDTITSNLACAFHASLSTKTIIAIIDDHSIHYMVLVMALLKLRIPILLLSPRNSSAAVIKLMNQVNADALLYGESYAAISNAASSECSQNVHYEQIPNLYLESLAGIPLSSRYDELIDQKFTAEDSERICLIAHSSGTTGHPKAIRWSNRFLFYHMQAYRYSLLKSKSSHFVENSEDILLGITPLCHMFGTYSCFAPFTGGWSQFFPLQFPPSVNETIEIMKTQNITRMNAPPYYVNQFVKYMQETGDVACFQKLRLLLSGGAPVPHVTFTYFAKHKINFMVGYGQSECCPLLTSNISGNSINSNILFFLDDSEKQAFFKPFDKDRLQLIIRAKAPYLASEIALNENGEYETKDLFIKSYEAENGYIYVGRTDDTLVMSNGEKTNPLPMEDIIKANPMVSQCTVIGENQPCTSTLIELNFDVIKSFPLDVIIDKVYESVKEANKIAPNHSAILPEMVKLIPLSQRLPATDKGTVSRKRAIAQFQTDVDDMYTKFLLGSKRRKINGHSGLSVNAVVEEIVSEVLDSSGFNPNDSLFKQGLNSLLSIQLRNQFCNAFFDVPQDFLYDYSSIKDITRFFTENSQENLATKKAVDITSFNYQYTTELLQDYINRATHDIAQVDLASANNYKRKERIVLLTGATGSLGASILLELLADPTVRKVYTLVRPQKNVDMLARLISSVESRGYSTSALLDHSRLQVLPMHLEKDYLGFSEDQYYQLKSQVTDVIACAWLLDFNQNLKYYDSECIQGFYNMVKFASDEKNPIHTHFISSISACGAYTGESIPEAPIPADPTSAFPMGYGQSKFVVEQLLYHLVKEKNMPCFVHRVGQLCGDSETGMWNSTEMYPLTIMGGGIYMNKMPDLGTTIDWLPVDYAGKTIVDIMRKTAAKNLSGDPEEVVFHVVNTKFTPWSKLLDTLRDIGLKFDTIDQESWVKELSLHQDNPALKLLPFFEKTFKNNQPEHVKWETIKTKAMTTAISEAPTVVDGLALYLEGWRKEKMFDHF